MEAGSDTRSNRHPGTGSGPRVNRGQSSDLDSPVDATAPRGSHLQSVAISLSLSGARAMSDPERDPSGDHESGDDLVVVPIEQSIDLHSFLPRDVLGVVDAYLDAARERDFREVRLIHGRGKGVQRARIQQQLARDPRVERYADAPGERGGWGATIVWLRPSIATGDES